MVQTDIDKIINQSSEIGWGMQVYKLILKKIKRILRLAPIPVLTSEIVSIILPSGKKLNYVAYSKRKN